jgi:hypothetical protein
MFSDSNPPNQRRVPIWIQDYWGSLLVTLVGPLLLLIASIWQMVNSGKWFLPVGFLTALGGLISIIGGVRQIFTAPGNGRLLLRVQQLEASLVSINQKNVRNYQTIIKDELFSLSGILEFRESERISLYLGSKLDDESQLDDGSKQLIMLGRYSANSEYDKKGRGLLTYNPPEGVLGHAWYEHDGSLFVSSFDYLSRDNLQRWNLDQSVVEKFRMRSQTICVRPIKNDDYNHKTAALVFESINENGFSEDYIDNIMTSTQEGKRLCRLLKRMEGHIPDLSIASRAGL